MDSEQEYEDIKPLWGWVLVKKRLDTDVTSGGIQLPDGMCIPSLRARVLKIGYNFSSMDSEFANIELKEGDEVILHFNSDLQPVDIESGMGLMLVPLRSCIGVAFRSVKKGSRV